MPVPNFFGYGVGNSATGGGGFQGGSSWQPDPDVLKQLQTQQDIAGLNYGTQLTLGREGYANQLALGKLQGLNADTLAKIQAASQLAQGKQSGQFGLQQTGLQGEQALAQGKQQGQFGLANTRLQTAGQLAQTKEQGQFGLANTRLQNAGQLAQTGEQGRYALAQGRQQGQFGLEQQRVQGSQALAQGAQRGGFDVQQAKIGAQAAELPAQLQQQRFQQMFPYLQQQLGQLSGQVNQPYGPAPGGGPEISAGPVLNDQQIQQQVNAARAGNDASTQQRIQQSQQDLAGRGFGANSPLAQALQAQFQGQNLAANTGNERDLRLGAAQANAGQVLQGQQAREQQYASRQQEDIERRKPKYQMQSALLSALAGLV